MTISDVLGLGRDVYNDMLGAENVRRETRAQESTARATVASAATMKLVLIGVGVLAGIGLLVFLFRKS